MSANKKTPSIVDRMEVIVERWLFAYRKTWLLLFAVLSIVFLWEAAHLRSDASLEKMVPTKHPFIANYLKYENELRPLGNTIRIAIENTRGDIYSPEYINLLKQITDEIFYIPGIDRGNMRSLWTPNTLWFEATEEGLRSGKVVPVNFDGSPESIALVRDNVGKAGLVGELVANDHKSTIIMAPLLERDPETNQPLDYAEFSQRLEDLVRTKYQGADTRIHINGFAKLVGDLIHGAKAIGLFFLITVLLTGILVYLYSHCWKSTFATIGCCLLAVLWHLGIMRTLGYGLDPYSILVPFLTFAIGVSHAVQNINALANASYAGESRIAAAKTTFRLLFVPGTVALLCDVVGFSTLLVIDIGVIHELAISATVGVFVIIFTKMFLLPLLMSYAGISKGGLRLAAKRDKSTHGLARAISMLAQPRYALVFVGLTLCLAVWGFSVSRHLQVGDLDKGAPELRPSSVYNQDSLFFEERYSTSADALVIMVKTASRECGSYATASTVSRLQWALEETPGVQSTFSMIDIMNNVVASNYGGDNKWMTVSRNHYVSNAALRSVPQALYNNECSMLPVIAYLQDHKAPTLDAVINTVEEFKRHEPSQHAEILLAAGNAGVEAATNSEVKKAWTPMLVLVYGIVALLLLLEFRSFKVMICLLVPLIITSVLCEAVMTLMGLGVKVATLPVIALGVGIGVDYGIYLYNRLESFLDTGLSLQEAYFETMKTTGLAVAFTGITLSAGVLTWIFSDIKFQADMGLLLTFMFLWNMLGAVLLIPALAALLRVQPESANKTINSMGETQ